MHPFRDLHQAITLPFTALFTLAICTTIDWVTSPGHWWVQWVALGFGIAIACAWARALKLLIGAGLLAALAAFAYRHWGDAGRDQVRRWFDTGAAPR
jgi:hypothetical protein